MENKVEISLNYYNNMRDELNLKRKILGNINDSITRYSKDKKGKLEKLIFENPFTDIKAIEIDVNKVAEALGFDKDIEVIIK